MSERPKEPDLRALVIDARPLAGILIDVEPGSTQGLRRARPGIERVLKEIIDNQADIGPTIGILQSQVDELKDLTAKMALIDTYLPTVEKLGEMMRETKAIFDNRRHEIISAVAKQVDTQAHAQKNPQIRALYAATREYRSEPAKKSVKTRQQKAAAAAAATTQTDTSE